MWAGAALDRLATALNTLNIITQLWPLTYINPCGPDSPIHHDDETGHQSPTGLLLNPTFTWALFHACVT